MQIFYRLERGNKKKEFVAVGDQTANDPINVDEIFFHWFTFLEIKFLEIKIDKLGEWTYYSYPCPPSFH